MIERQILGEISYKIDGFETEKLVEQICRSCKVLSIYRSADSIFLTVYGHDSRKVEKLVSNSGSVFEIINRRGIVYSVRKYARRYGLIAGAVLAAAAIFFLSNIAMKIEVNGAPDDVTKNEIIAFLCEEGLKPGAYIPSQNFLKLSNKLFDRMDNIAWASIGNTGSVVTVNVSAATQKVPAESSRIPCNIVSTRDAVIKNASVRVGKLEVLIGDAVSRGQLLVSGAIERLDGNVKYFHANADIIGQYEQSAEFFQFYEDETSEPGKTVYRRGLKFFDYELPLPGELLSPEAEYSERAQETPVKLFGLTLPFSVTTHEYTEIIRDIKRFSEGEARYILYKKLDGYEKNILSGVKIISREITETEGEEGVGLSAHYLLEGPIGEIREIFIK